MGENAMFSKNEIYFLIAGEGWGVVREEGRGPQSSPNGEDYVVEGNR